MESGSSEGGTVVMSAVTKRFGSFAALKGIGLSVDRGERRVICSTSGSGKSTLLSILGCLDHPSRGRYFFDGEDIFFQSK